MNLPLHTTHSAAETGFAQRLLRWFEQHGRHDLPWQHPRSAYRVWLSEIMLQQTQVQTVIPYFERFVAALPDVAALASAPQDQVMALWSGLGYYARARNLHAAAAICVEQHEGELPADLAALTALPGIGRSTAGAILAQAHGLRFAILDGNVKRVLTRWAGIEGWPGRPAVERQLWALAEDLLPDTRLADYTQAIMDLGASVCTRTRPACAICPLQGDCRARILGLTAHLPTPKPAKSVPTRECAMLLAVDESGRVLLQKRDAPGVWNGLWSLPEAADAAQLQQQTDPWLHASGPATALPRFEHVFSHYRLGITPWLQRGVKPRGRIADNGPMLRWAETAELPEIGLPAPIRKLLQSLELK